MHRPLPSVRFRTAVLCLGALLLAAVETGRAQRDGGAGDGVRPLTVECEGRSFTVPAFTHAGALYMSVGAFARGCGLPLVEGGAVGKLELRVGDQRLKFTGGNPFVVLLDHDANTVRDVTQLGSDVIHVEAGWYVPVAATLPLIAQAWQRSCALDASVPVLRITRDGAARAEVRTPPVAPPQTAPVEPPEADPRVNTATPPVQQPAASAPAAADPARVDPAPADLPSKAPPIPADASKDAAAGAQKDAPPQEQRGSAPASATQPGEADSPAQPDEGGQGKKSGKREKWKLDCIVIDAGHGGHDPGAIGVGGVREKNVTLAIALKLGRLIENRMKGVRVVYTRKDDTFIEVDRRGAIGNAKGGKLFISIHCNATEKKPTNARGFEVYILRPGRTDEAIRVAEFENSVVKLERDYEKRYKKLTAEQFILVNMAQSAYVKYSERFAELLDQSVRASDRIGSKGVKQAGFYVLVGASMPSVLIESGFLSNAKEEQFLASDDGQQHMAERFYDAVESFAHEYEQSLKK